MHKKMQLVYLYFSVKSPSAGVVLPGPIQDEIDKYISKFGQTHLQVCTSARLADMQAGCIASTVNINCTWENKLPKLYLQSQHACLFVNK